MQLTPQLMPSQLITIFVAKRVCPDLDAAHGVHNITNRHIRAQSPHIHNRIHRQRDPEVVVAVEGGGTDGVDVLPDAEVVVDEGVVHPEDGVRGRGTDVGHHGADAVVAVGVGSDFLLVQLDINEAGRGDSLPSFRTALHASIIASRVTRLHETGIALRGQALVYCSAETVRCIGGSGTDVAC